MAVLALPFALGVLYTHGLHDSMPAFHGSDEYRFHYPLILQFAAEWPRPSLADYNSATTPLFHLLFAGAGKLVGYELWKLRLLNLLISYAAILLLYATLVQRLSVPQGAALLLAAIVGLSPYLFGISFILLTDNLAFLLLIAFVYFHLRYLQDLSLAALLLGTAFLAAALLTRQTLAYVVAAMGITALIGPQPWRQKLAVLACAGLAALPCMALMMSWQGVTPPSFKALHTSSSLLHFKSLSFGIAVVGFYALFLLPKAQFGIFLRRWRLFLAVVFLAAALLILLPMPRLYGDDGYLWRLSRSLPTVLGTSVLFYVLFAFGVVVLLKAAATARQSFATVMLAAFLLSTLLHKVVFQKYYDGNVLVLLMLMAAPSETYGRFFWLRALALLALFTAYTVAYPLMQFGEGGN